MEMKIDGKAFVPVGWVFTAFGTMISITIVGAFWVAGVNFRLQRIEEKLGIPPLADTSATSAYASEVLKHDDPERLSKSLGHFKINARR
jgi:hypothetical protein